LIGLSEELAAAMTIPLLTAVGLPLLEVAALRQYFVYEVAIRDFHLPDKPCMFPDSPGDLAKSPQLIM
jgi:hypothetical protein